MIAVKLDSNLFRKEMNNIINYSTGFLDGVQKGKRVFLDNLGRDTIELLKQYIDSNARVSPQTLHHVYEWYQVGSPDARLFDIDYTLSGLGLSFRSSFRQSSSVKDGSREPFYNKAMVMEQGQPVIIKPKNAQALRFEVDGEEVFTRQPVVVNNPGGATERGFEKVFDSFFSRYFRQTFLRKSGMLKDFENPTAYKKNLKSGAKLGRGKGIETGYRWIANIKAVG
jgi:hypothetical protein